MEDRTVPAQAVAVGPDLTLVGPGPNTGTHVGNSLFFLAHQSTDAPGVSEIWQVSGGTTAQQVGAPALAGMSINEIANVGTTLYVTAAEPMPSTPSIQAPTINLWRIDATAPGGAVQLTNFDGAGAADLQVVGNKVLFEQTNFTGLVPSTGGNSLWVSDGTVAGTTQLKSFAGEQFANLGGGAAAGGYLYFTVDALSPTPSAVWVTDGTAAGTQPVASLIGSVPQVVDYNLTAAGDAVYISESDAKHVSLWRGANGGATLVKSFENDNGLDLGVVINGGTTPAGSVYFALNQQSGDQVWTSDGTNIGTTLVAQLPPSGPPASPGFFPPGSYVSDVAAFNGGVYFTTNDSLMKADGLGGATPVPLPAGLTDFGFVSALGGRLYFTADDGVHGVEMWSTDGTAAGTARLTDINAGSGSSFPIGPDEAGGSLYVIASDGVPTGPTQFAGEKLWKLPDASAPAGAATTTTLQASPPAVVTGDSVTLTATVAAANSGDPAPTGMVVFRDDTQVYGAAPLVNGTATLSAIISIPGNHVLQAIYTGDANFDESISGPATVTAGLYSVTLTGPQSSPTLGQSVSFSAHLTPALGLQVPPGRSVVFRDAATPVGSAIVDVNGDAKLALPAGLAVGAHHVSAVVVIGGTEYDSTTILLTVKHAGTTMSLKSTAPTSILGQNVTLTAILGIAQGLPAATGTVTFSDGQTVLGSAPVSNAHAALLVSNLALGNHPIKATYSGDTNFTGSSAGLNQTVTASTVATTTIISTSAGNPIVGQQVALTANVIPSAGAATPVGSVTFRDGNIVIAAVPIDPTGKALLLTTSLGLGNHSITASFGGAGVFGGSTSAVIAVNVRLAATATLVENANPISSGQSVVLTATVGAAAGGTTPPSGTVTFYDGTMAVGSANLQNGVAKLTTAAVTSVGVHKLKAVYGGNGLYAQTSTAATYLTVRADSTTTTLLPPAAGTGTVTLSATVGLTGPGAGTPTGKVTFFDGGTALGTATVAAGQATLQLPKPPAGTHYLRAVFTGTGVFAGSSSRIVGYTIAATTSTVLQANSVVFGQATSLKATVTTLSPGVGKANGNVMFMDGTTVLGTAGLINGVASINVKLAVGPHHLSAVYAGNNNFLASNAAAINYSVTKAQPAVTFQASPDSPKAGANVTLHLDVKTPTPGAAGPTGNVVIMDGSTVISSGPLAGGSLIVNTTHFSKGTHTLTANYAGDVDYLAASVGLTLTIG
jgi:ELWxxDGT repeat protein